MSFLSLAFDTGHRRKLDGFAGSIGKLLAATVTIWVLYCATISRLDVLSITISFYSGMLALSFLYIAPTTKKEKSPWKLDWLLSGIALINGSYFLWQSDVIAQRITLFDPLSSLDMLAGISIICLTIEAMRRSVGFGLTVIVLLFIAYNLFGHFIPGAFGHGYIEMAHFLDVSIYTTDGLFGVPLRVAGTYAFLFVLFGSVMERCKGSEFFFDLASSLTGKSAGGPAKIAVISSGLYGTISGSPTSDVVTTGAITIPIMKRLGYGSTFAGAVEVAASTGGSLLPPVMGAAAFIMAEYTGIPYREIALAAIIPAILFYLPIYLQVHLRAVKTGLRGLDSDQIPPLSKTLMNGWLFIIPLIAISWSLLDGYTPSYSAIYGLLAVFGISFLRRSTRLGPKAIYETLALAAVRMIPVAGACAAAGLVIGGITMTGLASKFSFLVFVIAGDSLYLSVLVAAGVTLLLGLGMPTPSAYILAAVLISPVMYKLGIDVLPAQLFLFYFAVMSALTPPVAVAAYAASAIANANPLLIAVTAVKIAVGAFLVPFAFLFNNALVLQGTAVEIATAFVFAATGLAFIAVATESFIWRPLNWFKNIWFFICGLIMLVPYTPIACVAGICGFALLAYEFKNSN
jgi:TRAP transporter 4TM/12TM fusion protein